FANPASVQDTTRLFFRPFDTAEEVYDEDITYEEEVTAGYVMGVVDFNFLTVTGGVRVERTSLSSSPWTLVNDDESIPVIDRFEQLFFENSYTNVMPSIHLKATPFDNFVARLSWSNTIGRPNYDEVSGTSELEIIPEVEGGGTVGFYEGANADLQPFESENWDLSLEYYFPSGGIGSFGAFRKNIDNYIFEARRTQNRVEFQGTFFEELNFEQSLNLETAIVQGVEFSYDQAFVFLPGFLSGFGITANAAFINSEVEYPDREGDDLPLLRQPNTVFNLIPYYQKYGFELRAAITYRSEFLVVPRSIDDGFVEEALEAGFAVADFDRYEAARTAVDITAAYTFPSRKLKILAQARNLTNAPEQEYQGITDRYDRHQLFGASYFLGFTVNL
ncbi:MAG: TonB-dependent receptor, partial [Bacteroidota bacterium]